MAKTKITIDQSIKELERELKMRERCYPGWIGKGSLKRDKANDQFLRMEHALRILQQVRDGKIKVEVKQGELFPAPAVSVPSSSSFTQNL